MDSIKQSLAEMSELFSTRMATFQKEIDKASPSNPTVLSVAADFGGFKTFILKALETLQMQVELLARQVDQQEMRSRRKILLIHGLSEIKKEDTMARVIDVLKKHLKNNLVAADIARCHRMGRPRGSQARCVLVKFRDLAVRDTVWFGKTGLKGSGVIVSEFLTKPRHDVFMAARDRHGVQNCFTRSGNVYVLDGDGERRCVTSITDVKQIPLPQPPTDASDVEAEVAEKPAEAPGAKRGKRQLAKPRA